jgi:hypothetical protein
MSSGEVQCIFLIPAAPAGKGRLLRSDTDLFGSEFEKMGFFAGITPDVTA